MTPSDDHSSSSPTSAAWLGPVRPVRGAPAGVYIHVPFCARLCPYCDFAVAVRRKIPHQAYADALIDEFGARRDALVGRDVASVYVGGGTPSLLEPSALGRVLGVVLDALEAPPREVTLEANPANVDPERIAAWRAMGVNRISLGVQSFQDRYLAALGRNHDSATARGAVELLVASGIPSISIDLIFAGPGHTLDEWRRDLEILAGLEGLSHVSAYHLTVEPDTVFARRQRQGVLDLADDDAAVEMLEALEASCALLGMERYEVSSFGKPGHWSVHNTNYWTGGEYLGIGVGAHSFAVEEAGFVRRRNSRRLRPYMEGEREAEVERLSPAEHLRERLFLGVRTHVGLDFSQLVEQFQGAVDAAVLTKAGEALEALRERGWLDRAGAVYRPTRQGFLFADSMAEHLFDAVDV